MRKLLGLGQNKENDLQQEEHIRQEVKKIFFNRQSFILLRILDELREIKNELKEAKKR